MERSEQTSPKNRNIKDNLICKSVYLYLALFSSLLSRKILLLSKPPKIFRANVKKPVPANNEIENSNWIILFIP